MTPLFKRALVVALTLPTLALATAQPSSAADAAATGAFTQLSPTRVVDTRNGIGAPKGPLSNPTQVKVQFRGINGIAANATAVAVNVTVVNATQPGFVSLWGGSANNLPNVSTVNAPRTSQTVANMSLVTLSDDGTANLFTNAGGDVLIDAAGYWSPATTATAGRYNAITPFRTLDTRGKSRLAAGGTTTAKATGLAGIPADAAAVAITVTATGANGAGFVTAYPTGMAVPNASNLNVPPTGATVPNLAIVPVGTGGTISLYSSMSTDLIVDIAGWFTGASANESDAGLFVPISAVRMADSRGGSGTRRLSPDLPQEIQVLGAGMPSAGVSAVALNVTLTGTLDDGFATISPSGAAVPNASNLNFLRGDTVAGLSLAQVGANGTVTVTSFSSTDVLADVAGYFTGEPAADQGVHPTPCQHLMTVTHDDGPSGTMLLRDRTGTKADVSIASAVFGGEIAPNCDHILTVTKNANGSARVDRYSLAGRRMSTVGDELNYAARAVSNDGRYIYTAEGVDATTKLGRTIYSTNVYTGARRQLADMGAAVVWGIETTDRSEAAILVGAVTSTTIFGSYRVSLFDGSRGPETNPGRRIVQHLVSPVGNGTATLEVDSSGDFNGTAALCTGSVCEYIPDTDYIAFTPQGDFVRFASTDAATIQNGANGLRSPLTFDPDTVDISYPTWALGPNPITVG